MQQRIIHFMKNFLTMMQLDWNVYKMYIIKRIIIQEHWLFIMNLLCWRLHNNTNTIIWVDATSSRRFGTCDNGKCSGQWSSHSHYSLFGHICLLQAPQHEALLIREQVSPAVTLQICMWEALCSNLGPDWSIPLFTSVPTCSCWDDTNTGLSQIMSHYLTVPSLHADCPAKSVRHCGSRVVPQEVRRQIHISRKPSISKSIVTGSRYADCRCYPTAGYIVAAAGVTEFPEICAVATQRKLVTNFTSVVTISYS
jgi:hypothetical protein